MPSKMLTVNVCIMITILTDKNTDHLRWWLNLVRRNDLRFWIYMLEVQVCETPSSSEQQTNIVTVTVYPQFPSNITYI